MKRLKLLREVLMLFLLFPFLAMGQQQQLLSFEEALLIMSENNPTILGKQEEVKQKEYAAKAAKGLYLPSINVSAQAVAMSDPLYLDLSEVQEAIVPLYTGLGTYGAFTGVVGEDGTIYPDAISTAIMQQKFLEGAEELEAADWNQLIQEDNLATVSANITYPIYTGGKIRSANKAANVEVDIMNEQLRQTNAALTTELVNRYYGLVISLEVVELREQMLLSMEHHYNDAKMLYNNGMIAKVELLHAEVAKNEAQRELKQAKSNVLILNSGLKATLANNSTNVFIPTSNLFIDTNLAELTYWIDLAKFMNPQINQIEGKQDLAEINEHIMKASYMPNIALMGNYNLAHYNVSTYAPEWYVGVGLSWNIFDGMARRNNLKASRNLSNQVDYIHQSAINTVEAYVIKLYEELNMQIEQEKELQTTLELANEYCFTTEKAFNEGLATSSSVVEAHSKVLKVKTQQLKNKYDFDLTLSSLLQTVGTPEKYIEYCK